MAIAHHKKYLPKTDNDLLVIARRVIAMEANALFDLVNEIDERFMQAVDLIFNCKGRVIITGLGKSGAIGRKIAATFTSTGTASYFLHPSDGIHGDIGIVHKDDVVICLSKSGGSDELFNLFPAFRRLGVAIISITGNSESTLAKISNIVLTISIKEEACPHDLAPTTSSTAMLAMGDALAITLLEKRGFSREDFAFLHPGGALGKRLSLKVDDLMETGARIPTVPVNATMKDVVLEMTAKRGICMITDAQQKICGLMTNGDLNRLIKKNELFFHLLARDVMNRHPKVIYTGTLAYTVYKKMEKYGIIAMPVIDKDDCLIGVVHLHDIMRADIF